jgi:hypothetical protein
MISSEENHFLEGEGFLYKKEEMPERFQVEGYSVRGGFEEPTVGSRAGRALRRRHS